MKAKPPYVGPRVQLTVSDALAHALRKLRDESGESLDAVLERLLTATSAAEEATGPEVGVLCVPMDVVLPDDRDEYMTNYATEFLRWAWADAGTAKRYEAAQERANRTAKRAAKSASLYTVEGLAKMRESQLRTHLGRRHSPETKARMAESQRLSWVKRRESATLER